MRARLAAGAALMAAAAAVYALLHDVTELAVFSGAGGGPLIDGYREFRRGALALLRGLPFFRAVNGHLADFLWFASFALVFTALLRAPKAAKAALLVLMALLSEFSQLANPSLGTFDPLDLLVYAAVVAAYLLAPRKSRGG